MYIGLDSGDRCRNCGYDFSLVVISSFGDLPLRMRRKAFRQLEDLSLGSKVNIGSNKGQVDWVHNRSGGSGVEDPSLGLSPLSVWRPTAGLSKPRSAIADVSPKEMKLPFEAPPTTGVEEQNLGCSTERVTTSELAGARKRIGAALLDVSLLGVIDVMVIYLTLRLCGLSAASLGSLPLVPLATFLALIDCGYLVIFTAARGQTIGKMATGIRVIGKETDVVTARSAILRTVAYFVSALPIGLGFLVGLFSREGRALHDRLAETWVVRVS